MWQPKYVVTATQKEALCLAIWRMIQPRLPKETIWALRKNGLRVLQSEESATSGSFMKKLAVRNF
jgi:hypothetical protein